MGDIKNRKNLKIFADDIAEDMQKEREEEVLQNMSDNCHQLQLFDDQDNLPFYSQEAIETTVFLPNNVRRQSVELFRVGNKRVVVGKAGGTKEYGVLKIKHKDVLYALLRIWADQDWPTTAKSKDGKFRGIVKTTAYEVIRLLRKKKPGKHDYESFLDTLYDLKVIPIEIEDFVEDENEAVFSLIALYEKNGNELDIQINHRITKQYYRKEGLKVLYLETYRNLRYDLSKILYPLLDKHITTRGKYVKKVSDLCAENGLTTYKYNSYYQQKWKKAIAELNRIRFTNGRRAHVKLYENKDKELLFSAVVK